MPRHLRPRAPQAWASIQPVLRDRAPALLLARAGLPPVPRPARSFPSPTPRRARDPARPGGRRGAFATANSNCAGAECDTVWIGHSSAGPGGAFLGVGVGGVWDFDTDAAGTDSTQGWRRWALHYRSGSHAPGGEPSRVGARLRQPDQRGQHEPVGRPRPGRPQVRAHRRRRRVALGHDGGREAQRLQRAPNRRRRRSPARARPGAACASPATSRPRTRSPATTSTATSTWTRAASAPSPSSPASATCGTR